MRDRKKPIYDEPRRAYPDAIKIAREAKLAQVRENKEIDGNTWSIRMLTYNVTPSVVPAETK